MSLANKITLARVLLALPFTVLLASESRSLRAGALGIFIVAAFTDWIDGKLARRMDQVSDLGKFMDPLADKIFVSAALILFLRIDILDIPVWPVILIVAREFIVSGIRTLAASRGRIIAASFAGKLKTVAQMSAVFLGLVSVVFEAFTETVFWLIIGAAAVTVYSGYVYVRDNMDLFADRQEEK